jgi:hypothetical protein
VHGGPALRGPSGATSPGVALRLGPRPWDAGTAMSPCGQARRHTSRGAMAVLAWKFPRTRLPVGASALCVVVLCWLYIFPVYRLPNEKEIVQGVLQQGTAWRRNQTASTLFRYFCVPLPHTPLTNPDLPSSVLTSPRTGDRVCQARTSPRAFPLIQAFLSDSPSCHLHPGAPLAVASPPLPPKRSAGTCFAHEKTTPSFPSLNCI